MPVLLQRCAQLGEVIQFAVIGDYVAGLLVLHRLGAVRREVEDGKASMGEHDPPAVRVRFRLPEPGGVGAAMSDGVAHLFKRRAVRGRGDSDDARYSAHGVISSIAFAFPTINARFW